MDFLSTRLLSKLLFMHLDSNQAKLLAASCKSLTHRSGPVLASLSNQATYKNSCPSRMLTHRATSTKTLVPPLGGRGLSSALVLYLSSYSLV